MASPSPGSNLPPVQPPSGRFIAQLFLVPGLIVLVVVLMVLAINYLFVGGNTPDQFLVRLDSPTPDIRYRGANDLAQVLKRRESVHLKTDVGLALGLIERLDKAMRVLDDAEKEIGDKLAANKADPAKAAAAFRVLEAQRNYVQFLAASLGDFHFPAGVPLLADIILSERSPDKLNNTMRRRQALWALANLGENIKAFKELKPEQRNLVLANLRKEVDSTNDVRRRAARNGLFHLGEYPDAKDAELVRVDQVLAKSALADDQFLRSTTALAFNFWDGPLAEETLLRLSRDNGFGTEMRTPEEP